MRLLPAVTFALLLPAIQPLAAQTPVEVRLPVFAQVVGFPLAFEPVADYQLQTPEGFFIVEWVPEGESVEHWTQMQTLTGHRSVGEGQDAAGAARIGETIAANFLDGYRQACAVEVDALPLPLTTDQGARASFAAYIGCAHVAGHDHSEEMVLLVMVGARDSYTLQWAERGPAREALDRAEFSRWRPRLDRLSEARLCTPPVGEQPPYPSCD